jgi:hypothetical protein
MNGGGRPASDSGGAKVPCGSAMEEVAEVVLAHATDHGFQRRLVLRCRNVKGNPFSLSLARGDNEGGRAMAVVLFHPSATSRGGGDVPVVLRRWDGVGWRRHDLLFLAVGPGSSGVACSDTATVRGDG